MKDSYIYIYGKRPIEEMLARHPKSILQIYAKETSKGDFFEGLAQEAQKKHIPFHKVPDKKIESLVGDVNDQGIVAALKEFPYSDFDEWLRDTEVTKETSVILLDEIEDPHNVGAIIRTATAMGISAILIPKHRQAGINATVYKTSAGTVGMIPVIQIGNVNQTVEKLKKAGFWVAGLAADAKTTLWEEKFDAPFVFIIGSEGKGIREKTREYCDIGLSIPMEHDVESLNASVAAALICYEWRRKQS